MQRPSRHNLVRRMPVGFCLGALAVSGYGLHDEIEAGAHQSRERDGKDPIARSSGPARCQTGPVAKSQQQKTFFLWEGVTVYLPEAAV